MWKVIIRRREDEVPFLILTYIQAGRAFLSQIINLRKCNFECQVFKFTVMGFLYCSDVIILLSALHIPMVSCYVIM